MYEIPLTHSARLVFLLWFLATGDLNDEEMRFFVVSLKVSVAGVILVDVNFYDFIQMKFIQKPIPLTTYLMLKNE